MCDVTLLSCERVSCWVNASIVQTALGPTHIPVFQDQWMGKCDVELDQTERSRVCYKLKMAAQLNEEEKRVYRLDSSIYFSPSFMSFHHSLFSCIWSFSISHVLWWSRERQSEISNNRSALISSSSWRKTSAGKRVHNTFVLQQKRAAKSLRFQHFFTFKLLQRETTQAFLLEKLLESSFVCTQSPAETREIPQRTLYSSWQCVLARPTRAPSRVSVPVWGFYVTSFDPSQIRMTRLCWSSDSVWLWLCVYKLMH